MQTKKIENIENKFQNTESLWFWFISSSQMRNGFNRGGGNSRHPCELVDIETIVTRLHLSGKLSADHLRVMKEFGDKRRTPNQHIWAENRAAGLWSVAMDTLGAAVMEKGWIEYIK